MKFKYYIDTKNDKKILRFYYCPYCETYSIPWYKKWVEPDAYRLGNHSDSALKCNKCDQFASLGTFSNDSWHNFIVLNIKDRNEFYVKKINEYCRNFKIKYESDSS